MRAQLEPKKCIICGKIYKPRGSHQVTCGSKKCQYTHAFNLNRRLREEKARAEFEKGEVFVLNMEKWVWEKKQK
jgi:hypothetical protein